LRHSSRINSRESRVLKSTIKKKKTEKKKEREKEREVEREREREGDRERQRETERKREKERFSDTAFSLLGSPNNKAGSQSVFALLFTTGGRTGAGEGGGHRSGVPDHGRDRPERFLLAASRSIERHDAFRLSAGIFLVE